MTIPVVCPNCARRLRARDEFAGRKTECPDCGTAIEIPRSATAGQPIVPGAQDIMQFLDPPANAASAKSTAEPPKKSVVRRMLEALLDPRAIQWLLMIGGGLAVIGLLIWLVSKGVFDDPRAVAVAMAIGTLAMLAGGWYAALKTRYRVAGQALTFLACVVAPLNLWFYHAQGLITLEDHLWVGGLVCVLLYAATVYALRDGLFMFAVEVGVTLTVLLLAADLGLVSDAVHLSLWFMALAVVSIHAERAFSPEGSFPRRKFGLPLFWSGQAQLAFSLLVLLAAQLPAWLARPLPFATPVSALADNDYLAGGLWLAGVYLYVYSDLVVRRVGVYVYAAAACLLLAETTLLLPHLEQEGLIAALALTALGLHAFALTLSAEKQNLRRHLNMIAGALNQLPVLLGVLLHVRATSALVDETWTSPYMTGWLFVGAMLLTAVTNRLSAHLLRGTEPRLSGILYFFSAAALGVAAAGLLRQIGWSDWSQQAPALMLLPIAYIVASRLWRGSDPETPLARVAHVSTVVILIGTFLAAMQQGDVSLVEPVLRNTKNLLFGLTFAEAAVFYTMAGIYRRRSANAYFAMAAGCGALWQFLGYFGVATVWYEFLFAVLGVILLIAGRFLGLREEQRYSGDGEPMTVLRGVGLKAFQCGNAVLTLALIVTFLRRLSDLAVEQTQWIDLVALLLAFAAAGAATLIVTAGGWRRWYTAAALGLLALVFLQLNVLVQLNGWRKLEIFLVACGVLFLAVSHVARFREDAEGRGETITLGFWAGSVLVTLPLLIAMAYQRSMTGPVLVDDLALVTAAIVMLTTGCIWRIKATTLLGGGTLTVFLLVVVGSIIYQPQVALGVYLFSGGGVIFLAGLLLSIYRERLLALPEQIAKREGLFQVIAWQ
jgi:hypothetical protein